MECCYTQHEGSVVGIKIYFLNLPKIQKIHTKKKTMVRIVDKRLKVIRDKNLKIQVNELL